MNIRKIALVNGRGIEGTGMVRHGIEYEKFFNSKGIECKMYVSIDRKFTRHDSQIEDTEKWVKFNFSDKEQCEKYAKEVNEADLVIYLGVPAKAKSVSVGNSKDVVDNFYDYFVYGITKPYKMLLMMDHSVHSIIRNARWDEIAENVDMWGVHALDDDFMRKTAKEGIQHKPTFLAPCTFSFDEVRKQFWKPMTEKIDKTYGFIGRSAHWKGPELVYKIHDSGLRQNNFITTLEGMELSIGALGLFFNNSNRNDGPRKDMLDCTNPKVSKYTLENIHTAIDEPAILFGPYKRVEALDRLSRKKFGSNLYNLDERKYGATLEYAHCEVICSGVIPVFHRHHGANTINLCTGKPHYDINLSLFDNLRNTGTIWVDDSNIKEVTELMIQLDNDNELYDKVREISYSYWKGCYDAEFVFNKLLEDINSVIEGMGN